MRIEAHPETFPLAEAFTISRGSRTEAHVLTVTATQGDARGRGECVPYARYGETMESVAAQIASLPDTVDRARLQELLPPGAARNAVDCALWDLEARQAGRRVWELAGLSRPVPQVTAFTLSLDTPERDARGGGAERPPAASEDQAGHAEADMPRLEAVRAGGAGRAHHRRRQRGLERRGLCRARPASGPARGGAGRAAAARGRRRRRWPRSPGRCRSAPTRACHDRASLPALSGRYDMVNIKLDKTGGLTEALALRDAARAAGYGIMVGCMLGSSLAMAPAVLVAQGAAVTDLDGPLLLAGDRDPPLAYDDAGVHPPEPALWG